MIVTAVLGNLTVISDPGTNIPAWKLVRLDGWYDSPSVRTNIIDAPQQDRAFYPGKSFRSSKMMTLSGVVSAADTVSAITACWDAINAVSPTGQDVPLAYTDDSGTRYMNVRISGSALVSPFRSLSASFSIPLVAYDPRKLSAARTVTISLGTSVVTGGLKFPLFNASALLTYGSLTATPFATATNAGTAPAFPVFTLDGDMAGGFQIIRDDGNTLTYNAPLITTQELVIDSATLRVLGAGQNDLTGNLTRKDDMSIAAGTSHTYTLKALGAFTGTPTLQVTTTDSWW